MSWRRLRRWEERPARGGRCLWSQSGRQRFSLILNLNVLFFLFSYFGREISVLQFQVVGLSCGRGWLGRWRYQRCDCVVSVSLVYFVDGVYARGREVSHLGAIFVRWGHLKLDLAFDWGDQQLGKGHSGSIGRAPSRFSDFDPKNKREISFLSCYNTSKHSNLFFFSKLLLCSCTYT